MWIFYVFFSILGLVIGSFLNVIIYRLPNKTFFSNKRSYCPKCNNVLKWYDLIPVVSYIILLGKCRNCRDKISIRYPIVEIINALCYALIFYAYGITALSVIYMIMSSTLIVMSFIDIDTMEIPNGLILFLIILGVISLINTIFFNAPFIWWEHLIGAVSVSGFLYLVFLLTRGGIGGGDIKLMFAVGLIIGYKLIILSAFIGIIIGGILGIAALAINKNINRKSQLPLGPSLAMGIFITLFIGDRLINWYLGLLGL